MSVLETICKRRSIRKYQDRQIPREDLEKVIEAGTYAPNAGGGQRTIICGVHNNNPFGAQLMQTWKIPEHYIARCFVLLGYVNGPYPAPKPRKAGRSRIIE